VKKLKNKTHSPPAPFPSRLIKNNKKLTTSFTKTENENENPCLLFLSTFK
jgi:hypothetical protein